MSRLKVAHIIHKLKVGGVENAARYNLSNTKDDYMIFCLDVSEECFVAGLDRSKLVYRVEGESLIRFFFRFLRELKLFKPDLVVSSLWRSHLVSLVVSKALALRWVTFFHSSKFFHMMDMTSAKIALRASDATFCDSESVKSFLLEVNSSQRYEIVNFYFKHQVRSPVDWESRIDRLAFFGRLSEVKNLQYLFAVVEAIQPKIALGLDVYGSGEEFTKLTEVISERNLDRLIRLKGEISPEDVTRTLSTYKYYVQTSLFEGMSLSVVQAMSAGCCCFVSFVGEIKNYAIDLVNAVELETDNINIAAERMRVVIQSGDCESIAFRARSTFEDSLDYTESFSKCCRTVNSVITKHA